MLLWNVPRQTTMFWHLLLQLDPNLLNCLFLYCFGDFWHRNSCCLATRLALNALNLATTATLIICLYSRGGRGSGLPSSLSSSSSSFPISDPPPAFSCILLLVSFVSQLLLFYLPLRRILQLVSVVSLCPDFLCSPCPSIQSYISSLFLLLFCIALLQAPGLRPQQGPPQQGHCPPPTEVAKYMSNTYCRYIQTRSDEVHDLNPMPHVWHF